VLLLVLCRYVTNQAAAEELEVGRGLGCSYATGQCEKFLKENPKNNNFCPASWSKGEWCFLLVTASTSGRVWSSCKC
jgi:hypothetical protein